MFVSILVIQAVWIPSTVLGIPLHLEIVDMTHAFNNNTLKWPTVPNFELIPLDNGTKEGGYWFQNDEYRSGTHVGTHLDAPCHFSKEGWSVDEIPLPRLIAPVAVIDVRRESKADRNYQATIEDITVWEKRAKRTVDDMIVLLMTGWDKKWQDKADYFGTSNDDVNKMSYPALSREAARWLVGNRNIYGFGTDSLSLDQGKSILYDIHRILLPNNIYGLENVANVYKLPLGGATLHVMPTKITGASGAPVRLIATFPRK